MNAKIIEKFDKQRYRAVILEPIGLAILVFECFLTYFEEGREPRVFSFGYNWLDIPIFLLVR